MKLFALVFGKYVSQITVEDDSVQDHSSKYGGTLIETKDDGSIRKNHAEIGGTYDSVLDAFIDPQGFDSWVLNKSTCKWEPPIPHPNDGLTYSWDESIKDWKRVLLFSEVSDNA